MISFLITALRADQANYTKQTMHTKILIRNHIDTCIEMAHAFKEDFDDNGVKLQVNPAYVRC
jgi:hypothetical protein